MAESGNDGLNGFENAVEALEEITEGSDPDADFATGDCEAETTTVMKPPADPSQQGLVFHQRSHVHIGHVAGSASLNAAGRGTCSRPDPDIPVIVTHCVSTTSAGCE